MPWLIAEYDSICASQVVLDSSSSSCPLVSNCWGQIQFSSMSLDLATVSQLHTGSTQ